MPFIGSEALQCGRLNLHQLRTQYRAIYPDVYLRASVSPTLRHRTVAAWLWSHREGVVSGRAAAAWHGAKWVDDDVDIELTWPNARPPRGLRTSDARLRSGEFESRRGLRVTTPARTAFDIGRRKPLYVAVAQLDALAAATRISAGEVLDVAAAHPGARGLRALRRALDLLDAGAQSPQETRVRLYLIDAGLPRPATQIPVYDDVECCWYYIDMGWKKLKVGVEYDGDHHRTDRETYVRDHRRRAALARLRWSIVYVIAEDRRSSIVERATAAFNSRNSR